jgi:hypothetical protein
MHVRIFWPRNISTLLLTKHLSVGTFNNSCFLVLQAACFHNCIYFNTTLTNDGRYYFQHCRSPLCLSSNPSNGNATHTSFISSTCSATLPSPPLPARVATPIIDDLTNEFIRLNLGKWASRMKVAVLLACLCYKAKCVLQNSACVCEYMKDVQLRTNSVCCVDVRSHASVLWT